MKIKIPASDRKKALFIVDVQLKTLKNNAASTLGVMRSLVAATDYQLYIVATYHADENSMLYKQNQWLLSAEEAGQTDEDLLAKIRNKNAPVLYVTKQVRSAFKCDQAKELLDTLKANMVSEIHMIGYDINDCILATAYDAIDSGFYTYVIEEACNQYADNPYLVEAAKVILRQQNMTNNSNLFISKEVEIQ